MELLKVNWYCQEPIDFEHKQYILFSYLQLLDNNFYSKVLSPYLLHTEKLVENMISSKTSIMNFENNVQKQEYVLLGNVPTLMYTKVKRFQELETIYEILDFSIPLLNQRVDLGKKLHKDLNSILF